MEGGGREAGEWRDLLLQLDQPEVLRVGDGDAHEVHPDEGTPLGDGGGGGGGGGGGRGGVLVGLELFWEKRSAHTTERIEAK